MIAGFCGETGEQEGASRGKRANPTNTAVECAQGADANLSLHNNLTTQKKARFGRAACTPVRLTAIPLCLPQQPK